MASYNEEMPAPKYYEVLIADSKYRGDEALTYSSDTDLAENTVVTVPLLQRRVTGFVSKKVRKPGFRVKPVIQVNSSALLPAHLISLAKWIQFYYACSLGEALRQIAPTKPSVRTVNLVQKQIDKSQLAIELNLPLTADQAAALTAIASSQSHTILLHGETGSGKTRVYAELCKRAIEDKKSVIVLTPEIALTAQLLMMLSDLPVPLYVLHSNLTAAQRKKIWFQVLESTGPLIVIGPRSALFAPVRHLGYVIVDEAHEPSYKQEQTPHYHANRVASKLAALTGAKAILGTATPLVTDYYLASQKNSIVRMVMPAVTSDHPKPQIKLVDLRDKSQLTNYPFLSKPMVETIKSALNENRQALVYLNRRGTARLVFCTNCGWHLTCQNCDVQLTYHSDLHAALCHICGFRQVPPTSCPQCQNPDLIYKNIGTKTVADALSRFFTDAAILRFDSDNRPEERIEAQYGNLKDGKADIIVGTQILAKGLDLPKLGMVGVIAADSSLFIPDYTADERTFQLLYQVLGRVGRGHTRGQAVVQTYNTDNPILQAAINRNWHNFYEQILIERRAFRFPPFSYLLKLTCKRRTRGGAEKAAAQLHHKISQKWGRHVQIIGPSPCFLEKRNNAYYWQIVIKSKDRANLVAIARAVPPNWTVDIDPMHLL